MPLVIQKHIGFMGNQNLKSWFQIKLLKMFLKYILTMLNIGCTMFRFFFARIIG